ncbi:MAG TPA: SLBB domain-containing protein [Acidobacteriaceae bacterium]|nr:SLBB domain-containing protein [Acidobacteriaceae bacterium]
MSSSVFSLRMTRQLAFLALASCLSVWLPARAQDNGSGAGAGQNGAVDCSDPLLASSSQCNQGSFPLSLPNSGAQQPGTVQPPYNSDYTDNENFTRQPTTRQPPRITLPPEPLTDFQKFVAATTGQVLPIYGASQFRQVPSTFAPLDMTPVPPDYVIGPGDEIRIRVWGQVNFRADDRVDRTGEIYLPQVGEVHVAGMPFSALDGHLRAAIGRVYRNFDLTADLGQIRAIQVYLAGEARQPGVYTVSSLSTLVDALFASGGPSTSGSLRHILLRRAGQTVTDFDLYSLLVHGDKSKDVSLENGDVLFIPPAGPQVAITGSVRDPAIYELRTGETLADAIADAGGASVVAAQARISLERISDHRDRYAMEVAWDPAGLATPLTDGDLVRVFSIVPMYQKTVTLRGNTANQGRFAWHQGMRLSELIPDKDSLITRNYWWRRAQLGLPAPEFEPLENFPALNQPSRPTDLNRNRFLGIAPNGGFSATPAPGTPAPRQNEGDLAPNYQQNSEQNAELNYQQNAETISPAGAQDQTSNGSAQNGLTAAQSNSNTALGAERMQMPGQLPAAERTRVGRVAPDIDWGYADIERLDGKTLKTTIIPFDLGKLVLDHDASQDLALEPGDVVSIFSEGDIQVPVGQQTKFVRLEGEFVHAGVYTVLPGETLRDLVQRAGGFTPNAYLYGSEFTRETTRMVQQRRMDEYLQTLELSIQRGNLATAAAPASSSQDLASGQAAQASEQQLLGNLRQMRATGRIVLEFRAASNGLDALPDIPLEDGDRFIVPPIPSSVNVVGAVYDQNSFLYQTSRRAGTYLRLAGGPNRDADSKHAFIIRADGSVISREAENGIWGNEFANLRMNPGDTIVVPEKTFKPSALRGFLDWSQLFSQFALGAAALSVIQ